MLSRALCTLRSLRLKLLLRGAGCVLACLLCTAPALAVEPTTRQVAEYEAADEPSRARLLIKLASSGQHDLAETLLQKYPLQGPFAANRVLLIEGLILRARGDLTGAVQKYRDALADDPSLTLVRAELAKTLVTLEEDDSAKHHLDILAQSAPNEAAAQGVRAFMDQLDARRPLKFSAFFSIAPSSNINGGSNHSSTAVYHPLIGSGSLALDSKSQKQSGIGAAIGGSVGYSKRMGNDFFLVAAANAHAALYEDSFSNSYGLSETVELRYMLERGHFGLGLVGSQTVSSFEDTVGPDLVEKQEYSFSYGPRASLQYNVTVQDRVNLSATYEFKEAHELDANDGRQLSLNGSIEHTFDPSLSIGLFGRFTDLENGRGYMSFETRAGGVTVYKELPLGVTVDASGQMQWTDFDDVHPLFGLQREDKRGVGTVGLTKRDLNLFGFAPSIDYTYVRNISNIAAYDYDSHAVDFRLTKEF
jgi:outer membrane protein